MFLARFGVNLWRRTEEQEKLFAALLHQAVLLSQGWFAGKRKLCGQVTEPQNIYSSSSVMRMFACLGGHLIPGITPIYLSCDSPLLKTASISQVTSDILMTEDIFGVPVPYDDDGGLLEPLSERRSERNNIKVLLMLDQFDGAKITHISDNPYLVASWFDLCALTEQASGRFAVTVAAKKSAEHSSSGTAKLWSHFTKC